MKVHAVLLFGCLMPLHLQAEDEGKLREEFRAGLDANGRVKNRSLRDRTGWETVRAFEWWIELEESKGKFKPVPANRLFRQGERIRVRVEAYCDLYVYILNLNADGTKVVLVPEGEEKAPLVKRGETMELPPGGDTLCFKPPAGTERFRFLVSPVKLPWVASKELFKVQNGAELNKEEQAALDQLKAIQKKEDAKIFKAREDLAKLDSLEEGIKQIRDGKKTKGCEVEIIENTPRGRLVILTSGDPKSEGILVHEVVLKHGE